MADVYVYRPDCDNFQTAGLVGALAGECSYSVQANALGELTVEHPYDRWGKWRALEAGNLIRAAVPMPTLPEFRDGVKVTGVEIYRTRPAAVTPNKMQYLYRKSTGSRKLRRIPSGKQVAVSYKKDNGRWKVTVSGYGQGWMEPDGLEQEIIDFQIEDIEEAVPSYQVRDQLFEIQSVCRRDEGVTASALQIACQLAKNTTRWTAGGEYSQQQILNGLLENCDTPHEFEAVTDMADTRVGVKWERINPLKAMLDGEDGVAARWGSQFIADNWTLYFLKRGGKNRGLRVETGKNAVGVNETVSWENVVTRIVPVGETKDGKPLYLPEKYVDSPRIGAYSYPRQTDLKCSGCKVGTDGVTESIALARMREQAAEQFRRGCDLPDIDLQIDYSALSDGGEFARYRNLNRLFIYDDVEVHLPQYGISTHQQVQSIQWDVVRERMTDTVLGTLRSAEIKLTTAQLPSGISGAKLIPSSVGSAQLEDGAVSARHVQAGSINAEAIQAGAVTAEKLRADSVSARVVEFVKAKIDEINAGQLTADEFYASLAKITALMVGSITADSIQTDSLAAVLGRFVDLYADFAGVDFADIRDLTADEAIFRKGLAGEMYIDDLAVTSANLVSAIIGDLVMKGTDGRYYRVTVDANGILSTAEVALTPKEAADGQTSGGQKVVNTTVNAEDLTASTIKTGEALVGKIFADAMQAGTITAGQAMIASASIPSLYTTAIRALGSSMDLTANTAIRLLIQSDERLKRWFTFTEDGLKTGRADSTYSTLTDDTGFHILQLNGEIGSFARRKLSAEAVRVGKVNTMQPRMELREAPDGGMIVVRGEIRSGGIR